MMAPSYFKLYGGRKIASNEYRLFLQNPFNGEVYALTVSEASFERVMVLLGVSDSDAVYCYDCGSVRNIRTIGKSNEELTGYALVCMCHSSENIYK